MDGTLNGYQEAAGSTALYPGKGTYMGLNYCVGKLNGEAGETIEKVLKCWRDRNIDPNYSLQTQVDQLVVREIINELGDVLWYVSRAARELGFSLNDIAKANIEKLQDRQRRDKLGGSGDNR
jgi:NTP pyrophosphatase (non-canonical NTP hydrolase)